MTSSTQDLLWLQCEERDRIHNQRWAYQPSSRDLVRAVQSIERRPNAIAVALTAAMVGLGWWAR